MSPISRISKCSNLGISGEFLSSRICPKHASGSTDNADGMSVRFNNSFFADKRLCATAACYIFVWYRMRTILGRDPYGFISPWVRALIFLCNSLCRLCTLVLLTGIWLMHGKSTLANFVIWLFRIFPSIFGTCPALEFGYEFVFIFVVAARAYRSQFWLKASYNPFSLALYKFWLVTNVVPV